MSRLPGLRSRTRVSLLASPRPFLLIFGRGAISAPSARVIAPPHGEPTVATPAPDCKLRRHGTAFAVALLCCPLAASAAVAAAASDAAGPALRATLRAHLKNPAFTLDRKAEYVVTDAAVVEPAIDEALRFVDTGKPLSDGELASVKWRAESAYRRGLTTPAGLRALEALIASRFAQPRVTEEANDNGRGILVTLDHGRMPAPLRADSGGPYPLAEGADFSNGVPSSAFVARTIAHAAVTYPNAERVAIRFTLPTFRRQGVYAVAYQRHGWPASRDGWVTIRTVRATGLVGPYETRVYNDDFSPYTSGRYSVYENCTGLLYLPNSQAEAERLRGLAGKCLNHGRGER